MSISEPFRYRYEVFQSDIFVSDIGITDVDVGYRISPTLRSMSMPTYADWGHHCGSKRDKRYDSTGLFTVTYIYTGTVHVLPSVAGIHPTGLTADQGYRQVSTVEVF
jgi:hypothetical protein